VKRGKSVVNPHDIVYIEWLDSEGPDGWHSADRMKDEEFCPIITVGWLTYENEEGIVITGHKSKYSHRADIFIPKCAIKTRHILVKKGARL